MNKEIKDLVFGKNDIERIVGCEVYDDKVELFIQQKDGSINSVFKPFKRWVLCNEKLSDKWKRLEGDLHYKYIRYVDDEAKFRELIYSLKRNGKDIYVIKNNKESAMLQYGFTYFKNISLNEVSVLSFDIETTGIKFDDTSELILISNTFRKNGNIERKLFSYDDYDSIGNMLEAWCDWVREKDPSIITGHNIQSFDIPYLNFIADREGVQLNLGRDGSPIKFNEHISKFRKDATQFYEYRGFNIFGREVVDTMFLAVKYDFSRKYENYGLKNIIRQEGLEKEGRVFYDAGQIRFKYKDPEEFKKIKQYCIHDSDDSLALYDLMIPAQFYFARSVPKPFTMVINSATGSPINAILIRSYLQHGHSIPRETEKTQFEGAISEGNPGIYKYVKKLDVSSLYPSIILQYEIWDRKKDPKGYFYKMVEYFTTQRLADKAKYQETGDVYYRDLSESRKITINSAYGVMGAPGLQFNSPDNAALITRKGREILTKGIEWVKTKGYTLVNVDTDSFSYTKNVPMSEEEQRIELNEVNNLFPERIRWADDGYYKSVLVLKAKNYVLWDGKKKKIKGSALRSATREKALAEFIDKFSDLLLEERFNDLIDLYNEYVEEIKNIKDINRWAAKKTITEKVINPQRTNEAKVLEALGDSEFSAGDKRYFYFKTDKSLGLVENWKNDHDIPTFLKKLHNTVKIFESVVDLSLFPNYSLKKNLKLLYPKGVNNE